jgi:hypothetical protein
MGDFGQNTSFDIACLESEKLTRLFDEVISYVNRIRIETVPSKRVANGREQHPASTFGLAHGRLTIQLASSLDKAERIDAIAHELGHLLLLYRFGLGVVGRRVPRAWDREEVFRYCMSMNRNWFYLLGQVANTAHHLILIDFLKEGYGIESDLHLRLLDHNFRIIANDSDEDKESLYGKGTVAFEYERLIGRVDRVINPFRETKSFWKAYHVAQQHFGGYSFQSIPTPDAYEENILSFMEGLGYPREDFLFFPPRSDDSSCCKRRSVEHRDFPP